MRALNTAGTGPHTRAGLDPTATNASGSRAVIHRPAEPV